MLACALALHVAAGSAQAQHRTTLTRRQRTLASLPFDSKEASAIVISPDGTRGAYVKVVKGLADRVAIVIDGNEPAHVYERVGRNVVAFSPDSRRTAYAARRGGKWYVVVDGTEGEPFDDVAAETVTFSPDGARLAFVATRDGKATVVVDGRAGRACDEVIAGSLTFSPDGTRLAYAARAGGKAALVVDDAEGASYDAVGPPRFSRDGRRLAHAASSGGRSLLVVDGQVLRDADAVDPVHDLSPVFSPGGDHLAYVVGRPGRMGVVVDGPQGRAYEHVHDNSIAFSSDGRRVGYMAKRGAAAKDARGLAAAAAPAAVVVIDGQEGRPHDGVVPGSLRFSLDGRRTAYIAERVGADGAVRRCAVVDGAEGKPYDWVRDAPVFSPDGRHVAYVAERRRPQVQGAAEATGFESFAVVDGTEACAYPWLRGDLVFTPDGATLAYLATAPDDRFADAGEIPADPANASAGGRLVFERVRRQAAPFPLATAPAGTNRPVKLLVVEERIGAE